MSRMLIFPASAARGSVAADPETASAPTFTLAKSFSPMQSRLGDSERVRTLLFDQPTFSPIPGARRSGIIMRIAGKELSATWSCERTTAGYEITLESRSGKRGTMSERNADYKPALSLILSLLGAHEYILVDVQLTSAKALKLAPDYDARRVHIEGVPYPIALNTIDSHNELGRAIQRAMAGMFSIRTDPGGGNREKRTTLSVTPSAGTTGSDDLPAWLEFGTVDADEPSDRPFTGSDYRQAAENLSMNHRGAADIDPAAVERALSGHRRTQNALAKFIAGRGLKPLSPVGDPDFDLAWREDGALYVAEVKSITDVNEEGQLRLGLGQVLRYRHALAARHGGDVRAVIVAEREPRDAGWKTPRAWRSGQASLA